jgi:hypothetical protein
MFNHPSKVIKSIDTTIDVTNYFLQIKLIKLLYCFIGTLAHWHIGFNRKARKEGAERKVKQYPF